MHQALGCEWGSGDRKVSSSSSLPSIGKQCRNKCLNQHVIMHYRPNAYEGKVHSCPACPPAGASPGRLRRWAVGFDRLWWHGAGARER